jgi:hypothetical protein
MVRVFIENPGEVKGLLRDSLHHFGTPPQNRRTAVTGQLGRVLGNTRGMSPMGATIILVICATAMMTAVYALTSGAAKYNPLAHVSSNAVYSVIVIVFGIIGFVILLHHLNQPPRR